MAGIVYGNGAGPLEKGGSQTFKQPMNTDGKVFDVTSDTYTNYAISINGGPPMQNVPTRAARKDSTKKMV